MAGPEGPGSRCGATNLPAFTRIGARVVASMLFHRYGRHMNVISLSLLTAMGTVLIPTVAVAAPDAPLKSEYEKIRKERNQAPLFASRKMDADDARFIERVKATWEVQASECPDPNFAKIAALTGMEKTVAGVVAFHTHKTPPYSPEDPARNAKEAVIAATLTVTLPISVDSLVHTRDGLAYIKNSKDLVTVFEDTDKGLKRTVYVKPAPRRVQG